MAWQRFWPLYVGLFALAAALSAWLGDQGREDGRTAQIVRFILEPGCELGQAACVASGKVADQSGSLSLSLGPELRPLVQFLARVTLSGAAAKDPRSVLLDFRMSDMDMGLNRYRLRQHQDGHWSAQAILPVCATGRTDWVASVWVEAGASRIQAEFPFVVEP